MNTEDDRECLTWEALLKANRPAAEVVAAVYALADIMGEAPADAEGYRQMAEGALMIRLVERGVSSRTAARAIGWAAKADMLREVSRRPTIHRDTVTLRKLAAGQLAEIIGPRPASLPPEPAEEDRRVAEESGEALARMTAAYTAAMDENGARILAIAGDTRKSADDRMRQIVAVDRRACAWPSTKWAELLGVSDAAIRKTLWWRVDRMRHNRPE